MLGTGVARVRIITVWRPAGRLSLGAEDKQRNSWLPGCKAILMAVPSGVLGASPQSGQSRGARLGLLGPCTLAPSLLISVNWLCWQKQRPYSPPPLSQLRGLVTGLV